MTRKAKIICFILLVLTANVCGAGRCALSSADGRTMNVSCQVEGILKELNRKTQELESYQCGIEYLFEQPIFESRTLRKGNLYYRKYDGNSVLRINFKTYKQDDEKEEKYKDEFIFDGVWLTHIDYQLKTVQKRQVAEANDPSGRVDVFEKLSENFPLIGFSKIEELTKEFEIKLVDRKEKGSDKFIRLHLKVKADSVYKNDYKEIDFWIDKKLYLPAKIVSFSTEEYPGSGDVYQLKFLRPKVNKKINKRVFEFEIPKDFDVEIIPLKKHERERGVNG